MRQAHPLTLEHVFNDALERPPGERTAFLNQICSGNPILRAEVDSLLQSHIEAEGFLEVRGLSPETGNAGAWSKGAKIGPYRLERLLGVGGMGAVWEATRADAQYEQRVAIKFVRRDMATALARARFRRERQVLADLNHPNITNLIDGGTTADGLPFLVMELVEGLPIDRCCDEKRLKFDARIELFQQACQAVQYAHQRLVIHRDIKPANMLVTPEGRLKLLDFGISKIVETSSARSTATRMPIGALTLRYASPEQLRGESVTTATDVYSLGVVLYELLTGRSPFGNEGNAQDSILPWTRLEAMLPSHAVTAGQNDTSAEVIAAQRGLSTDRHRRHLKGDLDNILMTALRNEPDRRYASVEQFANDLNRYCRGLPVFARRDTVSYRASKFIRRHKLGVVTTMLAVAALCTGLITTAAALVRARKAESAATAQQLVAESARQKAESVGSFLQELIGAANPYRRGGQASLIDLLAEARRRVETEFTGDPAVAAEIHCTLGQSYSNLWKWPEAMHHAQKALALAQQTRPPSDPFLADCLVLYGRALTWHGNAEAIPVQQRALQIRRKNFGENDPRVAESLVVLGFALWSSNDQPRWDEADRHYREGLAIYRQTLSKPDRREAIALFSHGAMLSNHGRPTDAAKSYRDALAIFRVLPNPEDRYYWACLDMLSRLLHEDQAFQEELPLLIELQNLTPKGQEPNEYSAALWRMGEVKKSMDDHAGAVTSFEDALIWRFRFSAQRDNRMTQFVAPVEALLAPDRYSGPAMTFPGMLRVLQAREKGAQLWWTQRLMVLADTLESAGDEPRATEIRQALKRCSFAGPMSQSGSNQQ